MKGLTVRVPDVRDTITADALLERRLFEPAAGVTDRRRSIQTSIVVVVCRAAAGGFLHAIERAAERAAIAIDGSTVTSLPLFTQLDTVLRLACSEQQQHGRQVREGSPMNAWIHRAHPHPPPVQAGLQSLPDWHCWEQNPPEQLRAHSEPASQICVQNPPPQ